MDPDAYRIVVDRFEGKAGTILRSGVVEVLEAEESVDLVSIRLLDEQGDVIDGSADGYAAAGKRLNVVAIVRAKIRFKDDRYRITFTVIRSRDGTAAGKLAYEAEKVEELRERVKQELWRELEPILAGDRKTSAAAKPEPSDAEPEPAEEPVPAVEEPEPEPEPEPKSDKPPPEPPGGRRCAWLEIDAQGGLLTRNFDYTNEQRGALRGFKMRGSGVGRVDATFYPWALSRCTLSSGLGVAAGFESAFGAKTTLADRSLTHFTFGTRGEIVFKIPIGNAWLTPRLGYVGRRFLVQGDFVPDVDVHTVGGGLDAGLRLGWFFGELGGSVRAVLGAGQLQSSDWFPDATGLAYDGGLRLGVGVARWLDVFLGGHVEYYSYALNTTDTGVNVNGAAEGAHDAYLRGTLGLRFHVPVRRGAR